MSPSTKPTPTTIQIPIFYFFFIIIFFPPKCNQYKIEIVCFLQNPTISKRTQSHTLAFPQVDRLTRRWHIQNDIPIFTKGLVIYVTILPSCRQRTKLLGVPNVLRREWWSVIICERTAKIEPKRYNSLLRPHHNHNIIIHQAKQSSTYLIITYIMQPPTKMPIATR